MAHVLDKSRNVLNFSEQGDGAQKTPSQAPEKDEKGKKGAV